MSPEQARGNPSEMDDRSDVFGLGAILYEIVSGKVPYGNERDPDRIIELAKSGRVVSIDEATKTIGISKRIRAIIAKATQPNPAARYQTVVELQREVHNFLLGGLHLPRKAYAAKDIILREGDPGDAAFMIVSGNCRVFRNVDGRDETLGTMGPGEVFGEMAILLDEPRAASVEALEPVTVLVLDKATFTEGLGIEGWTGALVRALAQRFRDLEQKVRTSGMKRD
jgi:serine/threonine-protein kinase